MDTHKIHTQIQFRPTRVTTQCIAFFCLSLILTPGFLGCAHKVPLEEHWTTDLPDKNWLEAEPLPIEESRERFGKIGLVYINSNLKPLHLYGEKTAAGLWAAESSNWVNESVRNNLDISDFLYKRTWEPFKTYWSTTGLTKVGPNLIAGGFAAYYEGIGTALWCLVSCPVLAVAPIANGLAQIGGGIGGAVNEAVKGISQSEARKLKRQIANTISISKVQKAVGNNVAKLVRRQTKHPIVLIGEKEQNWKSRDTKIFLNNPKGKTEKSGTEFYRLGPAVSPKAFSDKWIESQNPRRNWKRDLEVESEGEPFQLTKATYNSEPSRKAASSVASVPTSPPQESGAKSKTNPDIKTVLEISVQTVGMLGEGGSNPVLMLLLDVRAELFDTTDGKELYAHTLEYTSAPYQLTEWGANRTRILKKELNRASQNIARSIIEEAFLGYGFE